MLYLFYGALIFWALFFATPREGVVVALVIFAICILKMLRLEIRKN